MAIIQYKDLADLIIDLTIKTIGLVVYYCPLFIKKNLIWCLAYFVFDVVRFRRFTMLKNIQRVLPDLSYQEKKKILRKALFQVGYNIIEVLETSSRGSHNLDKYSVFHGLENWEKALARNKGVLLLSLHLGSGDGAIQTIANKGIPVSIISKEFKSQWFNSLWFRLREKSGLEIFKPHGKELTFQILKSLKKNRGIIFVLDQYMSVPYGVTSTFFGYHTGTANGLSLFAMKTGAPVVLVYCYRDSDMKNHIVFEPELDFKNILDSELDREQKSIQLTQFFNHQLERVILKYPDQWMWLHKRWKWWG